MTPPRLELELVPRSAHKVNLRAAAKKSQWKFICTLTVQRAGGCCEVCGAAPTATHPLETHEVWDWNEAVCRQSLVRTTALCFWCHLAKHAGMAEKLGLLGQVHRHMMRVNGWGLEQLDAHNKAAWRQWLRRSTIDWTFEPDLAAVVRDLEKETARQ